MKKLLIALLCAAMALSLAACGGKTEGQPGAGTQSNEPQATEPPATEPPATEPPATEPPATEPPATEPPATEPPATEPPATEPPATEPPATEPEDTTPTPPPIFPGPGGFVGPGFSGGFSGALEDIPVADAGELVDTLDAICQGIVEGSHTETLTDCATFANYFGGKLQYTEGMRVATNRLEMAPPAHIVMLIEVPEGKDPQEFAKELEDNANPRWLVCASAESVQTAVKDNLVLFVMSNEDTANAVIAAFNG